MRRLLASGGTGGLVLAFAAVICAQEVPFGVDLPRSAAPAAAIEDSMALGTQLESIERDAIIKALEKTRYNKTAAAKVLGMSFRALRYRIKKLGIE